MGIKGRLTFTIVKTFEFRTLGFGQPPIFVRKSSVGRTTCTL